MLKGKLILFARLDSSRLPNKQLLPLTPEFNSLNLMVARLLQYFDKQDLILASTNRPVDNDLKTEAARLGIEFFGGDAHNTTLRMVQAIESFGGDFGVRICGDSPLMDGAMVRKAFDEFCQDSPFDIYSNIDFPIHIRPPGQVAEFVKLSAMKRILELCQDPAILEHCTYYIHLNKRDFQYGVFERQTPISHIKHLALDTKLDYEILCAITKQLSNPVLAKSDEIAKIAENILKKYV